MREGSGIAVATSPRDTQDDECESSGGAGRAAPLRLLLVDEQPGVLNGLCMRLSLEHDLDVVGTAADAAAAMLLATTLAPDLVLLDVALMHGDGIALVAALRQRLPCCRVVVLTLRDDRLTRRRTLEAGAAVVIFKREHHELLLTALRRQD